MRFCCKTVPRLSKTAPEWRPDFNPDEMRAYLMDMTEDTGQKLLSHKSLRMPVRTNHKEGGEVGRVVGGYRYKGAMYHIVDIDESTEHGRFVADQVKAGLIHQVSLTHIPEDPSIGRAASNVELSLCVGNGARKGSGIIRVWGENEKPPVEMTLAQPRDDEFERERSYYLDRRTPEMISASEESVIAQVAEFNHAERTVPLVQVMSTTEPAPEEEKMKESEVLEEKIEMWDRGLRPDDAVEGDTYFSYLVAKSQETRVPSAKLKMRLLKMHAEQSEHARRLEDTVRCMTNLASTLIKKHGSRATPRVTMDELGEAERQLNTPAIQGMLARMQMVEASEEKAEAEAEHRRQMELLHQREVVAKLEQKVIQDRELASQKQADRESKEALLAQMRRPRAFVSNADLIKDKELFIEKKMPDPVDESNPLRRQVPLQSGQASMIRHLSQEPYFKLQGMSEEDQRALMKRLSSPTETQPVLSTEDYLRRVGCASVVPSEHRYVAKYIPGMVSCSEDAMEEVCRGRGMSSSHLSSMFNQNIDKSVVPYIMEERRRGNNDALNISRCLQSGMTFREHTADGHHMERYRRQSVREGFGSEALNGWRFAHESANLGQKITKAERKQWY